MNGAQSQRIHERLESTLLRCPALCDVTVKELLALEQQLFSVVTDGIVEVLATEKREPDISIVASLIGAGRRLDHLVRDYVDRPDKDQAREQWIVARAAVEDWLKGKDQT